MVNIDRNDIAKALINADEEIQNAFFYNMSRYSVEMIKEDINHIKNNTRDKDIKSARQRILNEVRELEETGWAKKFPPKANMLSRTSKQTVSSSEKQIHSVEPASTGLKKSRQIKNNNSVQTIQDKGLNKHNRYEGQIGEENRNSPKWKLRLMAITVVIYIAGSFLGIHDDDYYYDGTFIWTACIFLIIIKAMFLIMSVTLSQKKHRYLMISAHVVMVVVVIATLITYFVNTSNIDELYFAYYDYDISNIEVWNYWVAYLSIILIAILSLYGLSWRSFGYVAVFCHLVIFIGCIDHIYEWVYRNTTYSELYMLTDDLICALVIYIVQTIIVVIFLLIIWTLRKSKKLSTIQNDQGQNNGKKIKTQITAVAAIVAPLVFINGSFAVLNNEPPRYDYLSRLRNSNIFDFMREFSNGKIKFFSTFKSIVNKTSILFLCLMKKSA